MSWIRLNEKRLRNIGGEAKNGTVIRAYGSDGNLWPRLVISIYRLHQYEINGQILHKDEFHFSCSEKKGPGKWWNNSKIPLELLPEMTGILNDFIAENS